MSRLAEELSGAGFDLIRGDLTAAGEHLVLAAHASDRERPASTTAALSNDTALADVAERGALRWTTPLLTIEFDLDAAEALDAETLEQELREVAYATTVTDDERPEPFNRFAARLRVRNKQALMVEENPEKFLVKADSDRGFTGPFMSEEKERIDAWAYYESGGSRGPRWVHLTSLGTATTNTPSGRYCDGPFHEGTGKKVSARWSGIQDHRPEDAG